MKYYLIYVLIAILMFSSCMEQDPCKDKMCGTVCRGENLWEQTCVNGECIDHQIIEAKSEECGYDPCKAVMCDKKCRGTEFWEQKCLEGACVFDYLIEKDSPECGYTPPPPPTPPPSQLPPVGRRKVKAEEYAVYKTLIETGFNQISTLYTFDEVKLLVIHDHTAIGYLGFHLEQFELEDALEKVRAEISGLEKGTCENFIAKNEKEYRLYDYFDLSVPVLLISSEESRALFEKNGWYGFYKEYPEAQGIITLSRVGFNSAGNQAFLYMTSGCNPLCGSGSFVFLLKENGIWMIKDSYLTWIS